MIHWSILIDTESMNFFFFETFFRQNGLELRNPPHSASLMLAVKECATTPTTYPAHIHEIWPGICVAKYKREHLVCAQKKKKGRVYAYFLSILKMKSHILNLKILYQHFKHQTTYCHSPTKPVLSFLERMETCYIKQRLINPQLSIVEERKNKYWDSWIAQLAMQFYVMRQQH